MNEAIPEVVDNILNKAREFRDNSKSKSDILKDLLANPKLSYQKNIQDHVAESSRLVQELFSLLDELDTLESQNARRRN